jgi:hypothetical protein
MRMSLPRVELRGVDNAVKSRGGLTAAVLHRIFNQLTSA